MIDSGGYRYMITGGKLPSPREAFEAQLRILDKTRIPTILCALDHPMAESGLDSNELDRRITQTIANAYEFRLLVDTYGLDQEVESMAIVQGYDPMSIAHCAQELKAIGFRLYGVGSLAGLQKYQQTLYRVRAAVAVVGKGVHVFGVSSIRTIRALMRIGVSSIDSSRPAKSAAYNELLYARPFRRLGILVDGQPTGTIRKERCLTKSLPCECPICQQNSQDILQVGKRDFIRLRAIHNYYQMKWAIKQ
jgi:tRNA-guanine family transglycosylase